MLLGIRSFLFYSRLLPTLSLYLNDTPIVRAIIVLMVTFQMGEKSLCYQMINPLTTNIPHYIEASQLVCITNQFTGFYMMGNIGC